jgi:signal peptidase I
MNNLPNNRNIVKNMGLTLLAEGKTIRIKAHGYSMYPCIKPGSLLLIEPIQVKGKPVPGEIIILKRENGLIAHRLIKIVVRNGETTYIARGDSNSTTDHPVRISEIAGRVVKAETTGENPVPADIRINTRPHYIVNRIRVICLMLWKSVRRL